MSDDRLRAAEREWKAGGDHRPYLAELDRTQGVFLPDVQRWRRLYVGFARSNRDLTRGVSVAWAVADEVHWIDATLGVPRHML